MVEMMDKVRAAAAFRNQNGLSYRIEVDGGINPQSAAVSREAGADTLVVGTSAYGVPDMAGALRSMRG
jgi:ribulose-phosphate 3-epimerase